MFSNFFFNLKTGCSLEIISPERVSVRFPDQVGKKMGRKEGGGKLCKLHSGSDDENWRARSR